MVSNCINEILPNSLDEFQNVVTKINRREAFSTFEEVTGLVYMDEMLPD